MISKVIIAVTAQCPLKVGRDPTLPLAHVSLDSLRPVFWSQTKKSLERFLALMRVVGMSRDRG